MAKLIYSMIQSLDGYTEDADGKFGWGFPADADAYGYINELAAPVGTYLYGRKIYDIMVYWETADQEPDQRPVELDFARQWQAAEKIVYSRTITEPRSKRTRIEREFDPAAVRRMKTSSPHDMTIDGPTLAGQAVKAGLVDEFTLIVCPVIVGGGKRFFPEGAKQNLRLIDERRFASGIMVLRYAAA